MKKFISALFMILMLFVLIFSVSCGKNEEPQMRKATGYRSDGTIEYEYEYGSNGQMMHASFFDADGVREKYLAYEYNESGAIVRIISYGKNRLLQCVDEFNGEKYEEKQIKRTVYSGDGKLKGFIEYDADGRIVKDSTRRRNYLYTYEYDDSGRLIKRSAFFFVNNICEDSPREYTLIEYTEKGRKESRYCRYSLKDRVAEELFDVKEYYVRRNIERVEAITYYGYKDNKINTYSKAEYNTGGKKIKETAYDADGKIIGYATYKYNKNGILINDSRYKADGGLIWVKEYPGVEEGEMYSSRTIYTEGAGRLFVHELSEMGKAELQQLLDDFGVDKLLYIDVDDMRGELNEHETDPYRSTVCADYYIIVDSYETCRQVVKAYIENTEPTISKNRITAENLPEGKVLLSSLSDDELKKFLSENGIAVPPIPTSFGTGLRSYFIAVENNPEHPYCTESIAQYINESREDIRLAVIKYYSIE